MILLVLWIGVISRALVTNEHHGEGWVIALWVLLPTVGFASIDGVRLAQPGSKKVRTEGQPLTGGSL